MVFTSASHKVPGQNPSVETDQQQHPSQQQTYKQQQQQQQQQQTNTAPASYLFFCVVMQFNITISMDPYIVEQIFEQIFEHSVLYRNVSVSVKLFYSRVCHFHGPVFSFMPTLMCVAGITDSILNTYTRPS